MSSAAATKPPRSRFGIGPQAVVVVLVLGLVGAMAIQPTRQLLAQRERIEGMAGDLRAIQSVNRRLEQRIKRLQDPDYIEQRAREIGLVKPGEIPFVVMPPSRRRAAKADRQRLLQPPVTPDRSGLEGFLHFLGVI